MDERDLLAARVLQHFRKDKKLFGNVAESTYLTAILYIIGAHCVDWDTAVWLQERLRRPEFNRRLSIADKTALVMDKCGLSQSHSARSLLSQPAFINLNNMVQVELPQKYDDRLYLFDSLFYQMSKSFSRVDQRHTEIVAALANGLNRTDALVEMFAYSGEAFIVYDLLRGACENHRMAKPLPQQDLVNLRLVLRQIDVDTLTDQHSYQTEETFTVIDSYFRENPAPLDVLENLFKQGWISRRALVILDNAEQSKNRAVLGPLKERLLHDDLLEAVIDFTSYDTKGSPVKLSAWVLNREKYCPYQTICLSIRPLLEGVESVSALQAAWLAAAICELWASPRAFRLQQYPHDRLGPLKGLYQQLFGGGYADVRGICKVMSSEDVLRGNVLANKHVRRARFSTFSVLDTRPLVDLILKNEKSPLCIYIIGDNGAGKSQLLSAMIGALNGWEISTVGIAFGASDRFPLSSQNAENSRFKYLGARNTSGFSASRVERDLIKSLLSLFTHPAKRDVFQNALETLKFRHQLYLMPEGVADEVLRIPENAHRVVALSDLTNLTTKPKGRMELALLRHDSTQIVRFKNLSSGEQQIIVLLGKVVSAATRRSVILVDEPEISLHVHWQQVLPSMFSAIARQISCAFVIATHSPTLIANARDEVSHCFLARDRELTPLSPDQRHSVETILLDGFKTYTPHNREIAERCAALVAQAIRGTNHSHRPNPLLHDALIGELKILSDVMELSGDKQDPRYQQDIQLLKHAREAIGESYKLAIEEFDS